ncbi:NADH:flavin oxidoreductase/NADH oxidase [Niveomyces insectorum RCEF 264]|uniref:NADH:flavin oxidoreductase/NADH oxidase n=1 Tax=Niveomyces insectorum RCEF 264 TaxID=1081102 RepID=A0A168AH79_9HYPO|nr:NADH:flavin oxidoreductase/NADH oxidase [Niveomyces insectorum RCEF 264]
MTTTYPTITTPRGAKTINPAAPGVSYYTPAQNPPAGTALPIGGAAAAGNATAAVPTLFTPLTIRGVTLANRLGVSPMCMYSADDGHMTDFHLVHLGQFALHGTGLTIVEATSVAPDGRISPDDAGLWQDSQIAPLKRVADFVHAQGHKIGIQLSHAGRKASTLALWIANVPHDLHKVADAAAGGWPDRVGLVADYAAAARRAVAAGIDVIELHGAHGYLIAQFLSPLSNRRTDAYGGSFANRTRFLRDVAAAVRAVIPATTPLFLRIIGTEWVDDAPGDPASWTIQDTIRLAKLLPDWGIDLLDVSSGGNWETQNTPFHDTYYQTNLAAAVRQSLEADGDGDGGGGANKTARQLLVSTVGNIATPELAQEVTQVGGVPGGRVVEADMVFIARGFLRDPAFVLRAAHQLGVAVKWPNQYVVAQWEPGTKI